MNKVGIDVLEVKRMEDYVKRELPMEKIFTEYEIEYIKKVAKSYTRMAGIFSAKEAFLKATGCQKRDFFAWSGSKTRRKWKTIFKPYW